MGKKRFNISRRESGRRQYFCDIKELFPASFSLVQGKYSAEIYLMSISALKLSQ